MTSGSETAPHCREHTRAPPVVTVPVAALATALVVAMVAAWNALGYAVHGRFSVAYGLLSLFLSINLLVCYSEVCLLLRPDRVAERMRHWRERSAATGRWPATEFLASRVPLRSVWKADTWIDMWAAYALYDGSYADRRSYGFNAEVANGFASPIPATLLGLALVLDLVPALVVAILGVALGWQWTYTTCVYMGSFYTGGWHRRLGRPELVLVWAVNSLWIAGGLLCLWISIRLALADGHGALWG